MAEYTYTVGACLHVLAIRGGGAGKAVKLSAEPRGQKTSTDIHEYVNSRAKRDGGLSCTRGITTE